MSKKVVSILPQGKIDVITLDNSQKFLTITMIAEKGGASVLEVPIESMEINGEKRYFTRYAADVQDEVVIEALSKN